MASDPPSPQSPGWLVTPLAIAALLAVVLNASVLAEQLGLPYPRDPWESGIMGEAWRAAHGQPVYEDWTTGHATHSYGAAWTWVLAAPIRFFGFSLEWARWITLASALTLSLGLARLSAHGRSRSYVAFCWAFLFGLSFQSAHYAVSARPDFAAFLAMAFGLWLIARALERPAVAPLPLLAGSAAIAGAFFLKQTAAAGACVPLIAVLMEPERWSGKRLMAAATPLVLVIAVIGALDTLAPNVADYMIRGVGSYAIQKARLPGAVYALASAVPAFFAAAAVAALAGVNLRGASERWLAAGAVIFFPISLLSRVKIGGDVNSYYPALACLLALALRLGPSALAGLGAPQRGRVAALAFGLCAAFLLLRSTLGDLGAATRYAAYRHGDGRYREAIRTIASIEGKVAAPDDPTLLIGAGRPPGLCAMFEEEMNVHHGFYGKLPPPRVLEEIAGVDFVMRTKGSFVELLSAAALTQAGFAQVDVPGLRGSAYELWQRKFGAR